MSTAAGGYHEWPSVGSYASPQEIRAGLLPEETSAFDQAWRAALDEAADKLDMTRVFETLTHWRRIAGSTQTDPDAHRRMLTQADQALRTGEQPASTVSWDQLKAELGLSG